MKDSIKNFVPVAVRVSGLQKAMLESAAQVLHVSVNDLVRNALGHFFEGEPSILAERREGIVRLAKEAYQLQMTKPKP